MWFGLPPPPSGLCLGGSWEDDTKGWKGRNQGRFNGGAMITKWRRGDPKKKKKKQPIKEHNEKLCKLPPALRSASFSASGVYYCFLLNKKSFAGHLAAQLVKHQLLISAQGTARSLLEIVCLPLSLSLPSLHTCSLSLSQNK